MNNQPTIQKNHMDILWHEFADKSDTTPITGTSLPAKASVIGRVGFMMLACGTGACAVAVASVLNGHVDGDSPVTVKLLGGDLQIFWNRQENLVYMTGPAATVFDGEIDVSFLK